MNTSENMKTLLETVDKIEQLSEGDRASYMIRDLYAKHGQGNKELRAPIDMVYRAGFQDGMDGKVDLSILRKASPKGNPEIMKMLKDRYEGAYCDGEEEAENPREQNEIDVEKRGFFIGDIRDD